jgi:spermidine synthase
MPRLHVALIIALAFLAGMLVMSYELLASRMIAPQLGNSIYTWSAVIAMVLAGATLGAGLGGWIRRDTAIALLPYSYLCAALTIAGIWFAQPLLRIVIASSDAGLPALSIVVAAGMTFLQATMLSFGGPVYIALITDSVEHVGRRYSALAIAGSLGSIAGVFLGGFFFIPIIGLANSIRIIVVLCLLMAAGTLALVRGRTRVTLALLLCATVLVPSFARESGSTNALYARESPYYHIHVHDAPIRGSTSARWLFLDFDSHSVETYGVPLGAYTEIAHLVPLIRPDTSDALVLGAGAYSIPKFLAEDFPEGSVEVIEIDPTLEEVGRTYFGTGEYPTITTRVGDPRYLLPKGNTQYDVVFNDIFNSFISVPSHVVTREFLEEIKRHLRADGIYFVNFIATGEGEGLKVVEHIVATMQDAFPEVYTLYMGSSLWQASNVLVLASPTSLGFSEQELLERARTLPGMSDVTLLHVNTVGVRLITDRWQPLDRLMRPVMKQYFPAYKDLYYAVTG